MKTDWVANLLVALAWAVFVPKPASECLLWFFYLLHFTLAFLLWTAVDLVRHSPEWREKPVMALFFFAPMVPMNLYLIMQVLELLWN